MLVAFPFWTFIEIAGIIKMGDFLPGRALYEKKKTGNRNATSHIIQAISMTVQRGNATSIMGTLGPLRELEDFFDVISPREEES